MKCVRRFDEIAVGGITRYDLRYFAVGSETPETIRVTKDELPENLVRLRTSESNILVVEPVRKNLEEFFVDIVRQE